MKNAFEIDGQWPLDDLAMIQLQGPDAAGFLHGQLSNAVLGLPPGQARPAAYCTAQGRLLANCVFWSDAHDQRISLMVSRDLADSLLRRLRLFVLRAKLDLSLAENYVISGVQGSSLVAETLHGLPPWSRQTLDGVDWIVAPHTSTAQPAAWRIQAAPRLSTDTHLATPWHAAQIASGWPWIRLASQDMFLPSTLNMDVNGSIDFKKGCYPGQEVVARSHYRGTVKRRLAWGMGPWQDQLPIPAAGADLYTTNNAALAPARPIGRLIECVLLDGQLYVAAETTLIDEPEAPGVIGTTDGPTLRLQLADPGLST